MKLMKYIVLFLSIAFCQGCSGINKGNEEDRCKQLGKKVNKLYLDYSFFKDATYARLDSALYLIDSIIGSCDKYYVGLTSTKLKILSLKKEYLGAINFINTLEKDKIYPLNKSILLKRFYAMKSQYSGDTISRNKYIESIVVELKDSIANHSYEIDSVFRLSNIFDITKNRHTFTIIQYYYYRSQIEGVTRISHELDSIRQKHGGNKEFFNDVLKKNLEENLMSFNGI